MPVYDIDELYSQMEQHIIASMKRNLMRHRREEAKLGEDYTQWQSAKLRELRRFRKENKAIIGGAIKRLPKDIQQHLLNEYRQGLVGVIKKHKEKFGDTTLTRDLSDGFFGTNDKKIQALINAVNNDLQAANQAALRMANDAYRQTIHKAAMFAANGVTTEKQAIEMAVHDFAKRGINCIKYSNGARHNIKEYSRMAVRTAEMRAMLMGEGAARQALGETLVKISKHGTACPLCVPFEGKVVIDDVYSGGTLANSKDKYERVPKSLRGPGMFLSEAMKQGWGHPNCRHGVGTFYIELLDDEPKRIEYPAGKHTEKTIEEIMAEERKAKQEKAAIMAADSIVDAIDKDAPKPQFMGEINKQDTEKTLDAWMLRIGRQDYETAIVIDNDGKVYKIDGETSAVNINGLSAVQLFEAAMIHNHPDNVTHYSFSAFDISEAIKNRFSVLRGFDSKYEYTYKTLKNTPNIDGDIIRHEFAGKYRMAALTKAYQGELDMDVDEYHYILTEMAKDYGFFYERKPR